MTESSEEKAVKLKRNMLLAESDSKQENDSSLTDDERNSGLCTVTLCVILWCMKIGLI